MNRAGRAVHPHHWRLPALLAASMALGACVSMPKPSEQWLTARHAVVVVDARTGRPVPGASVRLRDHPELAAVSDAAGRVALGPLIDSRGRLRNLVSRVEPGACVDVVEAAHPAYLPVSIEKGDNKSFRSACQNAVFEYQLYLNPR